MTYYYPSKAGFNIIILLDLHPRKGHIESLIYWYTTLFNIWKDFKINKTTGL